MTFAVLQKNQEPLSPEQLQKAFRRIPGMTVFDAEIRARDAFGILARGLNGEQATALQAALQADGVESEVAEEPRLPALPTAKILKQLEFTPEALMIYDPYGRKFPVEWAHVILIAAGRVRKATFKRTATDYEVTRKINVGPIPIKVNEVRTKYSSIESAEWVLRAEIVLTRGLIRYSVEAENLMFNCLAESPSRTLAENFSLLVREFARHAPQAALSRGTSAILTDPVSFVSYPHKKFLDDEAAWWLWRLAQN
jgi:hypothetical protein